MMRFLRKGEGCAFSRPIQECSYLDIKAGGKLLAIVLIFCFQFVCLAQESRESGAMSGDGEIRPLLIGEKVPEDFWTMEHLFYVNGDTIRKTLEEHKGKMLILDFWASWCGSCLHGFGHLEKISTVYGDQCEVILVNCRSTKDDYKKIHETYLQTKGKYWEGKLSMLFQDNYLDSLFPHIGVPFIVWINEPGTVYSFTRGPFVDADLISKVLR